MERKKTLSNSSLPHSDIMTRSSANTIDRPKVLVFYTSIIAVFLVIQLTQDVIQGALQSPWVLTTFKLADVNTCIILSTAPTIKGIIFFFCISILCFPLLQDLYRNLGSIKLRGLWRTIVVSISAAIIIYLLTFSLGNDGMGLNYARISVRPFNQDSTEYSTRLLMPAIAYFLHLRGFWLYYIFFIILTISFIALLYAWNEENAHLNFWQFVSLCTSSFVIFQFEIPGYPDILVFIFFILVMWGQLSSKSKLSLLILALITHESSALIALVLAWRYLQRKDFITYISVVIVYGFIWFVASGFSFNPILASHYIAGQSGLTWLIQSPLQEIIGILIAFKALWILLIFGMVLAFRQKLFADAMLIIGCVVAALVMTGIGVDTSRLIGYAFPSLLIAISIIKTNPNKISKQIFSLIFLANLCIPSFNSVLSSGIAFPPGLYELLYYLLAKFFGINYSII